MSIGLVVVLGVAAAYLDGWLYTGLQDGRIVRLRDDGSGSETLARTGGRPFKDPGGGHGTITSVNRCDGRLWLGSTAVTSVGRIEAPVRDLDAKRTRPP